MRLWHACHLKKTLTKSAVGEANAANFSHAADAADLAATGKHKQEKT